MKTRDETTAKPEYCDYCNHPLGTGRRIAIVGYNVLLHPQCVHPWCYRQATRDAWREPDTSGAL